MMQKQWYQKNLRFLQTVLREIDIVDYDPKSVVAYMKEANANTLVVNAGGVIDFFQNPLDMANPNRFFKKEILHDICDEIHKAGFHVITRVDFRGVENRRFQLHPDWFAKERDGDSINHGGGNLRINRPCYHSVYANEHAEKFIDYIMKTYAIDGIWQNALGFDHSPCYCKNCRDSFRNETGNEIPAIPKDMNMIEALDSAAFSEYRAWKEKHADRHIERMRAAVKKYGEDKAYCAEIFDFYNTGFEKATGIGHENAKKSFDFIISCVFLNKMTESGCYDYIHNAASTIRFSRALDAKKQPVICTGGNGTRWRYIANPKLEDRLWQWGIASVGGGIWNCYFNGQNPAKTHDRRNAYNEKEIYSYLASNSESISDTAPYMDVAIYFSNATKNRLCTADARTDQYGAYIRGIERVLLENHIQYGFVTDTDFSPERLKGVKALLVPNAAFMPDKDAGIIREYVKNGGGLVASHETSLYDERGNERGGFGLADVFGLRYTGCRMDTSYDTYQLIRDKNNPILNGVGDTEVLMNGGTTILNTVANPDVRVAATHIPRIHNQPPEYAWIPDMKTAFPTISALAYGKGRAVYFANGVEAQCFIDGHEDYTEIYKNAVDYATGGGYLLTAEAPRSVHINAIADQHNSGHIIVSFVNTTGTHMRPIKETVPVFGVKAHIPLCGRRLKSSKILYCDNTSVSVENDGILLQINVLNEFASFELWTE